MKLPKVLRNNVTLAIVGLIVLLSLWYIYRNNYEYMDDIKDEEVKSLKGGCDQACQQGVQLNRILNLLVGIDKKTDSIQKSSEGSHKLLIQLEKDLNDLEKEMNQSMAQGSNFKAS